MKSIGEKDPQTSTISRRLEKDANAVNILEERAK
jgi:hypothetical protein